RPDPPPGDDSHALRGSTYGQTQETHHAAERSKPGAECQCKRRAIMAGKAKAQGGKCGAEGLSGQARGCDDAARASTAVRRRARHQCPQIGRLEEAESNSAD